MCYEIDSEVILANVLRKRSECSLRELLELKNKIEKKLSSVYVDVTINSVLASIESHPRMFYWKNDRIHRVSASQREFFTVNYINTFFNTNLNDKIRVPFEELIKEELP
jgi:hypothetical protein